MTRTWRTVLAAFGLLAMLLLIPACNGDDDDTDMPEPTASSVWEHMQQENYTQNWRLWPGTEALYRGSDPHGMLLSTYVNDVAYDAFMNTRGTMPDGAIIANENYMPDSTFDAITTMYKVEGYNAEHNDWFWVRSRPSGKRCSSTVTM